jgi:hypothetical protein
MGLQLIQGVNGDVYSYLNTENVTDVDDVHKNKACPILAVVSDIFWLFSSNRLCTYEIALGWNECLQKHFPALLQRLAVVAS